VFGNKQAKQERLSRAVRIIEAHGEVSIMELARELGVHRCTVDEDLVALHLQGVPLYEGRRGRLGLAEWWRRGRGS
jgi:predicted DNA-binding transcriptional regulator YafY